MKKIISAFLALVLAVGLSVTAFAVENAAPATLAVSGTTGAVTVSGAFAENSGVTAAAVVVLSADSDTVVAFKTFAVLNDAFSGSISASLTAGTTYTVKAANYDGGDWKTETFTVPGSVVVPSAPAVAVPAESGAGSVKLGANVTGGTAAITAGDAQIKALIADSGGTGNVVVDLSALDVNAASLPAAFVSAAQSDGSVTGLTLRFRDAALTLDKPALAGLTVNGGSVTLSVAANPVLTAAQKALLGDQLSNTVTADFTVISGGTKVSNLGGTASISLKLDPSIITDPAALRVWCIDDPAGIENMGGVRYDAAAGIVSFETAHNSVYAAVSFPFTDVSDGSWAYGSAAYAYMHGLFSGTSVTAFSPEEEMTRGMFVTVLRRLAGNPAVTEASAFSDVAADAYYAGAVAWAASAGIAGGVSGNAFAPDEAVTREQIAAILFRFAQYMGYDVSAAGAADITGYTDAGSVSDYAVPAVRWACGAGLMQGYGGRLTPTMAATRAQAAVILRNFCLGAAK